MSLQAIQRYKDSHTGYAVVPVIGNTAYIFHYGHHITAPGDDALEACANYARSTGAKDNTVVTDKNNEQWLISFTNSPTFDDWDHFAEIVTPHSTVTPVTPEASNSNALEILDDVKTHIEHAGACLLDSECPNDHAEGDAASASAQLSKAYDATNDPLAHHSILQAQTSCDQAVTFLQKNYRASAESALKSALDATNAAIKDLKSDYHTS